MSLIDHSLLLLSSPDSQVLETKVGKLPTHQTQKDQRTIGGGASTKQKEGQTGIQTAKKEVTCRISGPFGRFCA